MDENRDGTTQEHHNHCPPAGHEVSVSELLLPRGTMPKLLPRVKYFASCVLPHLYMKASGHECTLMNPCINPCMNVGL